MARHLFSRSVGTLPERVRSLNVVRFLKVFMYSDVWVTHSYRRSDANFLDVVCPGHSVGS